MRCFRHTVRSSAALSVVVALLGLAACGSDSATSAPATEGSIFRNLRAEDIGSSRAVIRFDTTIPTTCEVEYGLAVGALDLRATDPSMVGDELSLDHEVPLEDLQPGTSYQYRGYAIDGAGRVYVSDVQFFTTLDPDRAANLVNVATLDSGTAVTAVSSNFGGGPNDGAWGADLAIDGRMETEWATNGDGDDAFLVIDLGQEHLVTHFGFRSRVMPDGSSIIQSVELVVDAGARLGPFATPDPDESYLFALEPPVAMQQVRLEAVDTSGGNTGAKEVQLFITP